MHELRFLKKNTGETVLQYKEIIKHDNLTREIVWLDVPTESEPKKKIQEYVLKSKKKFVSEIKKGLGKIKFETDENIDYAIRFTEIEARIFLEENNLSLFHWELIEV